MGQKKLWSSAKKFEIALLAIKNETTISDICKKYEVSPTQVYDWKKQLLEQGANLFEKNDKSKQIARSGNMYEITWTFRTFMTFTYQSIPTG